MGERLADVLLWWKIRARLKVAFLVAISVDSGPRNVQLGDRCAASTKIYLVRFEAPA